MRDSRVSKEGGCGRGRGGGSGRKRTALVVPAGEGAVGAVVGEVGRRHGLGAGDERGGDSGRRASEKSGGDERSGDHGETGESGRVERVGREGESVVRRREKRKQTCSASCRRGERNIQHASSGGASCWTTGRQHSSLRRLAGLSMHLQLTRARPAEAGNRTTREKQERKKNLASSPQKGGVSTPSSSAWRVQHQGLVVWRLPATRHGRKSGGEGPAGKVSRFSVAIIPFDLLPLRRPPCELRRWTRGLSVSPVCSCMEAASGTNRGRADGGEGRNRGNGFERCFRSGSAGHDKTVRHQAGSRAE